MKGKTISRSMTKFVDMRVSVKKAFDFLNNLENWPKWAIVNMKSVKRAADGWFDTETRYGKGQLKMLSNEALGLLDHMWKDPQASWTVPARLVPNAGGSTFMMTFFQPPALDDNAFDAAGKGVEKELAKLKEILEEM